MLQYINIFPNNSMINYHNTNQLKQHFNTNATHDIHGHGYMIIKIITFTHTRAQIILRT